MNAEKFLITTSWDDGYPADSRVAELLAKYGIAGTFYIPSNNVEGRAVMSKNEISKLATNFEIGAHTRDHISLLKLAVAEKDLQLSSNKKWLEDIIGTEIIGFCYPRGHYDRASKCAVKRAGFSYARTNRNFSASRTFDPFAVPTTVQFYPHTAAVYLRNFFYSCPSPSRLALLGKALSKDSFSDRLRHMVDAVSEVGGIFHIWGHSWEVQELDLWDQLEDLLRQLASKSPHACFSSNREVAMNGK